MPTYDYECTKCHKVFELFQSIAAPAKRRVDNKLKSCKCDAPVVRLIGAGAGVIFKGSGFYQTDYRSDNYKKGAKAEKDARSKKDDSGSKKGEKKTESKKKPDPQKADKGSGEK